MNVLEKLKISILSRVNRRLIELMSIEDGSCLVFASKPETVATQLRCGWVF